jgi:multiple sugar transport system substrate-binding protein
LKVENDPSFADKPSAVLGGQKDIPVYKTASSQVLSGWQYLPYNLYANSIFKDTVGQQFASGGDVNAGLKAWQKALAAYGTSQGFTVKAG